MMTSGHPPNQRRAPVRPSAGAVLLAVASALVLAAGALVLPWSSGASAAVTVDTPWSFPGKGATVPFTEIEAENATTNGTIIGSDRVYTHLPSEASGRRAVTLNAVGKYVEFTLAKPANAMSVRYSIPDNAAGTGLTTPVDVLVNGSKVTDLSLTSNYSWYYGGYPFSNSPGDGNPHHFYDETRTMFASTLAAGTKVRIQVSTTSVTNAITIDLADFETVGAPIARPSGSLSVDDYGAARNGSTDSTAAFQAAVDAGKAQGKVVYIPQGTYTLYGHVIVDNVTLVGAGPWYSVLTGRDPGNRSRAAGIYGKYVSDGGPSQHVTLKDFAIIGSITERVDSDQVNALGGAMSNTVVDDLWLQHTKVGAWMDGPMDNFKIQNSRILDMTADGVNFHTGVTNSTVTNTFVRNTGDDGLAMWPENKPNVNDSFTHDTVVAPVLANDIVTYGGKDITISDNVAADTVTNGGGIHVANRYPGVNSGSGTAVSGTITVARNALLRAGNSDYNWNFGVGALWFDGLNEAINATINISDSDIIDSSYEAIQFIEGGATNRVNFSNVNIAGTGTYMIQAQAGAVASFTGVKASYVGAGIDIHNCVGGSFAPTYGSGNSGWDLSSTTCTGQWPPPNYIYPGGGGGGTSPTPTPTPTPTTCAPGTGDIARGKPVTESSHTQNYVAGNAVDGDANSYWESANNVFPQNLTVDLCGVTATTGVGRVVLKLPPSSAWGTRDQALSLQGSSDGSSFTTLVASKAYTFNPSSGNTVTITVPATQTRYLRVTITANTGWPAGQLSELEVYAS